jgi:hypothetical protein
MLETYYCKRLYLPVTMCRLHVPVAVRVEPRQQQSFTHLLHAAVNVRAR